MPVITETDDQTADPGRQDANLGMTQGTVIIPDDTRRTLRQLYQRARDNADDELGRKIERSWRYYDGNVDAPPAFDVGRAEDGTIISHGSSVVVREVWDKIQAVIPKIARVFLSSDEIVSFEPRRPGQEEQAAQATDYLNYEFWSENEGEELLLSAAIDWMVKFAVFKVYWQAEVVNESRDLQVDAQGLQILMAMAEEPSFGITLVDAVPVPDATALAPDLSAAMGMPILTFDQYHVRIERETSEGRIRMELVPQDELLVDPDAQSVDDALMIGQDCYRTVSEVVSMGVPFQEVQKYAGKANNRTRNDDATYARRGRISIPNATDVGDPALDYVRVVEGIVKLDQDGDGVAERVRVLMLGEDQEPIWLGPGNDCYYIVGSPFRRPHEVVGTGYGEQVDDLQDQKTALTRGLNNNLNRSLIPREIIPDQDDVAYADLKSPLNGLIRSANPGAITFHQVPYHGDKVLGHLQYYDQLATMRTGVSAAGQGLDPDVLKGQTVDGAKAITLAPDDRIEYLVREFAASLMRPIFKAGLKLSVAFQDKPKSIRLRGKWVEMVPTDWDALMDCSVAVGLGTGTRAEKLQGITAIGQRQIQLQATGSASVTEQEIGEVSRELCRLVGYKNTARFFKELSPQEIQQADAAKAQAAQQQVQQQAQLAIAVESAKAKAKADAEAAGAQQKEQLLHERETARMQIQVQSDAQKHQAGLQAEAGKQAAHQDQSLRDHALKVQTLDQGNAQALAQIAAQERATLDKQQREHALKLDELAAETQLEQYRIANRTPSGDANIAKAGSV